jgi:uncharacterized protein YcbK (DUF882 family)
VSAHTLRRERYREWLTAQGMRFGFDAEIAGKATAVTNGVTNDTPPVELWHRILPTVKLAEALREAFGATTVNSAYRSPTYNTAVGGETASRHMENDALDLRCASGTPAQWAAALRERRRKGEFRGGIGTYATFVHVDTRGVNRDWNA